ncbi:MAG: hypothetical protein EON47_18475, partial [Acetobacteraceae bacterium]
MPRLRMEKASAWCPVSPSACASAAHAGEDIVIVAHGGSIRAALAHALGLTGHQALAFSIRNLGVTRLERVASDWRVAAVNEEPWNAPDWE